MRQAIQDVKLDGFSVAERSSLRHVGSTESQHPSRVEGLVRGNCLRGQIMKTDDLIEMLSANVEAVDHTRRQVIVSAVATGAIVVAGVALLALGGRPTIAVQPRLASSPPAPFACAVSMPASSIWRGWRGMACECRRTVDASRSAIRRYHRSAQSAFGWRLPRIGTKYYSLVTE